MTEINFLTACDMVDEIIRELRDKGEPMDGRCELVVGYMPEIPPDEAAEMIERMQADGLAFLWICETDDKPPYALIDIQHNQKRIILPPYVYVETPQLVGLMTTNGVYVEYIDPETNETEQAWTRKYKLGITKDGYPVYDNRILVLADKLDEAYGEHTRH